MGPEHRILETERRYLRSTSYVVRNMEYSCLFLYLRLLVHLSMFLPFLYLFSPSCCHRRPPKFRHLFTWLAQLDNSAKSQDIWHDDALFPDSVDQWRLSTQRRLPASKQSLQNRTEPQRSHLFSPGESRAYLAPREQSAAITDQTIQTTRK